MGWLRWVIERFWKWLLFRNEWKHWYRLDDVPGWICYADLKDKPVEVNDLANIRVMEDVSYWVGRDGSI